jgi:hypothetical protein
VSVGTSFTPATAVGVSLGVCLGFSNVFRWIECSPLQCMNRLDSSLSLCRYLSTALFEQIRNECEGMQINERVKISDAAGREFYVP